MCLVIGTVKAGAQEEKPFDRLASIGSLGVALDADPEDPLAGQAFRALMLDLVLRGYTPVDLRNVSVAGKSISLPPRVSGENVEALAILRASTDSVDFRFSGKRADGFWQTEVPELTLQLTITAPPGGEEVFDAEVTTEGKVFRQPGAGEKVYIEFGPSLIQRSLIALLRDMPVCSHARRTEIRYRLPVVAYADQFFRAQHGELWQKVIQTRMDIAGFFFRLQFQLDLQLAGARPWESSPASSVALTGHSLYDKVSRNKDTIVLGFMLDPRSVSLLTWGDNAGAASFLSNVGVVRELPQTVDEDYWYTLKHCRVIVHEIAHMFGAVHVNDEESFLYPVDGFFGCRFDSVNATILNMTRRSFARLEYPERVRAYLPLIYASETWPRYRRDLNVESLQGVLSAQWSDSGDVRVRMAILDTTTMDSGLVHALAGLRVFSQSRWADARRHFSGALAADSTYIEACDYLERIAVAEGDEDAAIEYRRLGRVRRAARTGPR